MRLHASDLRQTERLLLAGRLEDAASVARSFVARIEDPGLMHWQDHARRVAVAAVEVIYAPSIDEALRREPRIAVACARCHAEVHGRPVFEAVPPLPEDDQTPRGRMARHAWATERLWEGLVGRAADRWTMGLQVLAETPVSFAPQPGAQALAASLQRMARAQLVARGTAGLDERAAAYGALLATCATCHSSLPTPVR